MSPALFMFLGVVSVGILLMLLTAIFGRWRALTAILFCGLFGLIALSLLSVVAFRTAEPMSVHHGDTLEPRYAAEFRSHVAIESQPREQPAPPIEIPDSPATQSPQPTTVIKAVGDALFNSLIKPNIPAIPPAEPSGIIPPGRPAWVDQEPESRDGVDYVSLSSGPYTSSTECYKTLKLLTREAVQEQTALVLGGAEHARRVPLDDDFIADNIHLQTYKESLDTSIGPMQQWHAFLQFNEQFRREVETRWKQVQQVTRLAYAGALFVGILTVLGVLYGALAYNSATGGRYRARLQTVAGAAILGVVGGAILLTQWFPPI